ncbi:IclR family transcriptional regulator [Prauserella cavernicola]|uniref:IclR family transcriptional regulator n=1 Tax=Prauserella cavernicola TaxID=2800127 RepID=A0A934QPR9_9PSEU|nr:IclR family transcriptional regulator [Prauserella cavernicola]MBK1783932.1 IclR family transcriptional regulator [Prauserella cavernicola]
MTESVAKSHRTVSRVTAILELAAAQPGVRLGTLASALDAPKSSVFGLVKGLVSTGYLVEDNGGFHLGPALGNLLTAERPNLADAARPTLEDLRDTFDETAMLGTSVGDSVVYVAVAESHQLIRYSPPLRHRRPLYPPSAGKVLLSHWNPRQRENYLRSILDDPAAIEQATAELERVRTEGVALNRGETLPEISATARPIVVRDRTIAAIAVAGPTPRIADRLPEIAEALIEATRTVAARLA